MYCHIAQYLLINIRASADGTPFASVDLIEML